MKRIFIQTIPHSRQRYNTVGDYQTAHGFILFSVSDLDNEKYEALVAVHELVEKILVDARGIPEAAIDQFDMAYETDRDPGDEDEPGNSPMAPYHREHLFASKIERLLADELGIDWDTYDHAVMGLS